VGQINVVGGHVALDLVNTVEPRVPGRTDGTDHLATPDDLAQWASRVTLLDEAEAERVRRTWAEADGGARALAATSEIREATYAVLLGQLGTPGGPDGPDGSDGSAALDVLVGHWRAAMGRSTLSLDPVAGPGDRLRVGTDPGLLVPDRLAHAAVTLLRTLDPAHLKTCPLAEGGCGWLFLDRSRNGSRRWCSMADCGARAKARRLTDRRRGSRAASRPG
jgi:predicted RNA-binding Zn ribbon-like protein